MKRLSQLLTLLSLLLLWNPAPAGAQPAGGTNGNSSPASQVQSPSPPPAASPAPAYAAPDTAPAAKPKPAAALSDMVAKGGFTFKILIGLSLVMVALIFFLMVTIRRGAVVSDHFMHTADTLIRKQDYLGLLAVCNRQNEAISTITQKALDFATKNPMATFDEVREVTQAEGQRQASQLFQRITYLTDIAAVAPMVGLLGTVIGLMSEFGRISKADMQQAQMEFAGGTAEALINTAAGLVIAIPAMIVASIYRGRVNGLVSELEAAATHIMALLSAQYKRITAARAPQSQPVRR
ncbi:MAG: mota/tolq/exbb proton channel family [Verrucomicrobiales bacterium]|nr:mota/tolq/exbb proton channel family [Verrucomicrobiales bacterium]